MEIMYIVDLLAVDCREPEMKASEAGSDGPWNVTKRGFEDFVYNLNTSS